MCIRDRGNTVDPFQLFDKYGADATRWYLLHVSPALSLIHISEMCLYGYDYYVDETVSQEDKIRSAETIDGPSCSRICLLYTSRCV